jgi:hypothetical protein
MIESAANLGFTLETGRPVCRSVARKMEAIPLRATTDSMK